MTVVTGMLNATDSEIVTRGFQEFYDENSPPTPARAGASISTKTRNAMSPIPRWAAIAKRGARRWWVWTDRPASLRTMWRVSAVDKRRVPLGSKVLSAAWRVSNATDRFAIFALALMAPTFLTGPIRWMAARPSRRVAFYLLSGVVLVAVGR